MRSKSGAWVVRLEVKNDGLPLGRLDLDAEVIRGRDSLIGVRIVDLAAIGVMQMRARKWRVVEAGGKLGLMVVDMGVHMLVVYVRLTSLVGLIVVLFFILATIVWRS